ncbi:MAG: hypothetical protein K2K35_02875 [Lachnospiraceae bacterium]|nr:hypothetical protein [Lachnospiraceae bacterium]
MDFLKLKMGIRKYCKLFFMLMAIILAIGTSQAAGSQAVKKASVNVDKGAKTKKLEDKSLLYKKVPVYGKGEKQKIKKYLFSLPDKITEEEAEKKGIVVQLYNADENNFNAMWEGFYKYAREGEKALNQKDGIIKCYAKPFKAAIVLLRYTTEGDACYTYISFIEGEYYVIADYSRDKFMKSSPDGIDEIGTFKSLRKRREIVKGGNRNYYDVIYSVFKKPYISKKEVKRIINKTGSYINKYYDLFDYYTSIK